MIIEVAFMDTATPDNDALHAEQFKQVVARAVRDGLDEFFGGQDTIPPTISSFAVTPNSIAVGNSFSIQTTVSDSGGSGLSRIELWRAPDLGGSPAEIGT